MRLPEFSVKKPVTILMLAAGIILLGVISWTRLPQELFPPITYPQITIVTSYENAAPEEVEALITRPIEESVSAASNIRKVSSTSREGSSIVICEFNWGTNMDFAALNIREKIDLIKEKLPRDTEEPIVMKYNPFDTPIMILSVTGDAKYFSPHELRETSRRIIKDEIEKIDGVAQVILAGGREREILVELNQERLRAFNISIMDVIELLKQANLNYPAGTIETSFYEYLVRTMGEFKTVPDMYDLPLLIKERTREEEEETKEPRLTEEEKEMRKRIIYLRELGEVKDTLKEQTSISRYNLQDNISLSVQRQADSNTLEVNKKIYERLKTLRQTLPEELKIKVVYDQSIFIEKSISELRNNALQGGVLAFIILLIFLRNVRSAIVVTIGIPISILFTLILMFFSKLSVNMMSLGGLALGVGMLVDNGIVVIENIYRHRQLGKETRLAAVEASNEVFTAIIGSTMTTVAVFLPLIFVVGIAGQLFRELALTVTFSLVASVVTAMSLTPMFMSRGKGGKVKIISDDDKIKAAKKAGEKVPDRFKGPLPYLIVFSIIGVTFLVAVISLNLLLSLDREFLPKLDQRQFLLKVDLPAGTNLRATDAVIRRIEDAISGLPGIKDVTVNIGSSKESKMAGAIEILGSNQANIIVNLKPLARKGLFGLFGSSLDETENSIATREVVQNLKDKLSYLELQDAQIEYILQESVFKSVFAGSAPLIVVLKGFELEDILIPATEEIKKQLKKIKGVYGTKDSLSPPSPEIKVVIRKDRAALYQLTVNQVASVAQAAIRGYVATKFKEEGREIDIRVRLRKQDRENFNKISKLVIFTPLKINVFLDQVAYLARGLGPTEIKRESKQRVVFISSNIYKRALNDVVEDTQKIVDQIKEQLPQNYSIEIGGESKEMVESFESLRFALILALVLVYMILASEFESLIQPFIIMFTVPLSLIGVGWFLFLSGTALSVVVVLGFIMLGGIVVNNGILLIDFINLARKQGMGIFEAAIQASRVRARPILMTSLTTIFGLLPLAFAVGEGSELRAPMAKTVMGGLATAAFLTLFIVPSVYILLETLKEAVLKVFRPAKAQEEEVVLIKPKKAIIEEINITRKRPIERKMPKAKEIEGRPEAKKEKEPELPKGKKILSQRQMEALDNIRINGRISRLEYVVKFKVPLPVADRELEELVAMGLLASSGEGPHKIYLIKKKED